MGPTQIPPVTYRNKMVPPVSTPRDKFPRGETSLPRDNWQLKLAEFKKVRKLYIIILTCKA